MHGRDTYQLPDCSKLWRGEGVESGGYDRALAMSLDFGKGDCLPGEPTM